MTHIGEEQLVLHYYGEETGMPGLEQHLAECCACRESYNSLRLVLNTVNSAPAPERTADYGERVWRRIQPGLSRRGRWSGRFQPRWWVLIPAAAAMMIAAFLAGRLAERKTPALAGSQVRERILLVAVGNHLDRSQMVLAELSNAPDGKGKIDISEEQQLASDLLDDNRLYRQTAHSAGDSAVAGVLDDLERVLMEIAHSPSQVSSDQLDQLRQEIRERGLLFKVRVIGSQVRQREAAPANKSDAKKG